MLFSTVAEKGHTKRPLTPLGIYIILLVPRPWDKTIFKGMLSTVKLISTLPLCIVAVSWIWKALRQFSRDI